MLQLPTPNTDGPWCPLRTAPLCPQWSLHCALPLAQGASISGRVCLTQGIVPALFTPGTLVKGPSSRQNWTTCVEIHLRAVGPSWGLAGEGVSWGLGYTPLSRGPGWGLHACLAPGERRRHQEVEGRGPARLSTGREGGDGGSGAWASPSPGAGGWVGSANQLGSSAIPGGRSWSRGKTRPDSSDLFLQCPDPCPHWLPRLCWAWRHLRTCALWPVPEWLPQHFPDPPTAAGR